MKVSNSLLTEGAHNSTRFFQAALCELGFNSGKQVSAHTCGITVSLCASVILPESYTRLCTTTSRTSHLRSLLVTVYIIGKSRRYTATDSHNLLH